MHYRIDPKRRVRDSRECSGFGHSEGYRCEAHMAASLVHFPLLARAPSSHPIPGPCRPSQPVTSPPPSRGPRGRPRRPSASPPWPMMRMSLSRRCHSCRRRQSRCALRCPFNLFVCWVPLGQPSLMAVSCLCQKVAGVAAAFCPPHSLASIQERK